MVLTAYIALSPVTGLSCHRRLRNRFRRLDASVGASGPHDFAVRESAPSSEAPPASTASRPASVTIASRPSVGRDRIDIFLLLPRRQAKFRKIRNWPDCVGRVRRLVRRSSKSGGGSRNPPWSTHPAGPREISRSLSSGAHRATRWPIRPMLANVSQRAESICAATPRSQTPGRPYS
jgi:hypothetical protein